MNIQRDDIILITGATGFVGSRVVAKLREQGFTRLRCLVRQSPRASDSCSPMPQVDGAVVEWIEGNLLSQATCDRIADGVTVVYHLAAGTGTKSFADAFANTVVTTRNLVEAVLKQQSLKRFVNVSSFAVYTNESDRRSTVLDESSPVEKQPELRGDPYCFAKVKQDELIVEYGKKCARPYVLVRPGVVYGPGKPRIHGRVGIDTFGVFLHLGGSNTIPLTYVDNCAEAIVGIGLKEGIDQETFNVVDDDLPTSRRFLAAYKQQVKHFTSFYIPHHLSYFLCLVWEKYSVWSGGQLPPTFNRRQWTVSWKPTTYSNRKLKEMVGWQPKVSTADGLSRFFASFHERQAHA